MEQPSRLRKENDQHYPSGAADGKGGEFAPKDGTSGDNGENVRLDYIRQKINEALKGKKAIAIVGGANDERVNGSIWNIVEQFKGEYPNSDVKYFPYTGVNKDGVDLKSWISEKSQTSGSGDVAAVGHSYGGDTVATMVADGVKVGALITIDPVSRFRPDLDKVKQNSDTWINVNGNPDKARRAQEKDNGNFIAGLGRPWGSRPEASATGHYNANINHSEARQVLLLKP